MGLICHYPLHGDSKDYSGNGKDLSINGCTISNEGKIGKCMLFNNSSASVSGLDNMFASGKEFSICVWINFSGDSAGDNPILSCGTQGANKQLHIVKRNNKPYFAFYSNDLSGNTTIESNKWYHMCFVYRKNTKEIYINGVMDSSQFNSNYLNVDKGSTTYIGAYSTYKASSKMNDIRIYNHALSIKEIRDVYKSKILHYNFNQMVEPTVNISSTISANTKVKGSDYNGDYFIKNEDTNIDQWWSGISLAQTKVIPGKTYTYSIEIMCEEQFNLSWDGNCSSSEIQGNDSSHILISETSKYDTPGKWKRVGFTSKIVENAVDPYLHHSFCPRFYGRKVYYRKPQVEEKQYFTEYTSDKREDNVIIDISGYGNNGTINKDNSPRWNTNSIMGSGSYRFYGSNYISLNNPFVGGNTVESLTICGWINRTSINSAGNHLISLCSNNFIRLALDKSGNGIWIYCYYKNGETYSNFSVMYGSSSDFDLNRWYHICTTFNNGILKIYIDGVLVKTDDKSLVTKALYSDNNGAYIGSYGQTSEFMNGYIDDVRIYATELSEQDILDLYNSKASISRDGKFYVNEIIENSSYCSYANGINLVRNGAGEYNDTTNFGNNISLITTDGVSNGKCFEKVSNYQFSTSEPIEVNTSDIYEVSGMFKSTGVAGSSKLYYGVQCLDENKSVISFTSCHYYENTKTTLAKDLNKGDTVVYLQSAANWISTNQGTTSSQKNIGIFDKKGFPDYICAKTTLPFISTNITDNTITLETPWPYSTVVAGTKVANNWAGSGYNYCATDGQVVVPAEWTNYKGSITGELPNSGEKVFRPGTRYVKLLLLLNYGQSSDYITRFTDCYIKNLSRQQSNQETVGFNVSKKSIATTKELNEIQPMNGLVFQADLEKDNYIEKISGQKITTSENFTRYISTPSGKTVPYLENIPGADPNAQYMGISRNIPALKSSADQLNYTMSIAFYTEKKDQMTEAIMFGKAGNHHGIMTHGTSVGFRRIETNYITNQSVTRFYTKPLTDDLIGRWNVFTTTYNKGTYKCYINGELVDTRDVTTPMDMTWINSDTWLFSGNSKDWVSYKFVGALTDARIYNRELSSKEVKQNYEAFMNPIFSIEKDGSIISKEFIEI